MKNQEKKWDVLTCFDACVDLIVDMGDTQIEFNQKEKQISSTSLLLGGSCCIFASQCGKLGLKTTGVGIVGEDMFGKVVLQGLAQANVDIGHIRIAPQLHTGIGISLNRKIDRAILTDLGAISAVNAEFISDELLRASRHLHIGSYYLLNGLREEIPNLLKRAKSFGLTTSLDTNWDISEQWNLPITVLENVDIFLPNETEAQHISSTSDLSSAASYFTRYIPVVVIKCGEKGARMYANGHEYVEFPQQVDVIDTIGAGDSFDAGFLYGYLKGFSLKQALRIGTYCGTKNTQSRGGCAGQILFSDLQGYI